MKWDDARNLVIQEALYNPDCKDADAIFWKDSDIILPPFAIARMAHYEKDFVTGIYFQKEKPHFPLIAHLNKEKNGFQWYMTWPKETLAPIDGCGFGCVLTSMKMIREMGEPPWFHFKQFSEDFTFCIKARDAGYNLMVDTGVICEHQGAPKKAGFEDFKKCHPKYYPQEGNNNGSVRSEDETGNMVLSGYGDAGHVGGEGIPASAV